MEHDHHPQATEENDELHDMSLQLEQLLSSDPVLHTKGVSGTTDDYLEQLAPILKDALMQNATNELLIKCEGFKKDRDREIDEMCSGDHNEYMASVQQLGQVTQEADNIKNKIQNINSRLNSTGQILAEKKNKLLECRRVRSNVDSAIEAVTACLQVLDLTNNVHELLQEKRKFAALKSLDDLQNVHLKEVSNFGFAQLINQSVPALTKMVRNDTISDIQKWLDSIQHMNGEIGKQAFEAIERQRAEWKQLTQEQPHLRKYKFNSPVEKSYRETGKDHLSASEINIDFSHLYECVLVHSSMGMSEEFQHHFDSDRKIQRDYLVPDNLTFKSDDDSGEDDLSKFEVVLQEVAGFCIIDRMISRNNETLRPPKDVEEIWDSLAQKINNFLTNNARTISHVESLKRLKEIIGTFLHTMQNAGFNTSSIKGILLTLFKTYSDYMKGVFQNAFKTTVTEDDYTPLPVNRPDLYKKILRTCWYTVSKEEENSQFPRKFPFSRTYPLTCAEMISFIDAHNSFLDDLQYDSAQVEDIITQAVDDLLVNVVCKTLEERSRSNAREQVVQTLVNIEHFQEAAVGIEKLLFEQRISGRRRKIQLKATEMFAKARKLAENQVFEIIHTTIDNLIELQDYDWETTVTRDDPSPGVKEMVSFLETLIASTFGNLPPAIKTVLYFETFDYLSHQMLSLLLESSNRLTYQAIHNFDVDVRFLESHVQNIAQSTNDISLTTVMIELRQAVDLIQTDDFHKDYNAGRFKKYERVKPDTAQKLFKRISFSYSLRKQSEDGGEEGSPTPGSGTSSPRTSTHNQSSPQTKFMNFYRQGKEKFADYRSSKDH